MATDSPLPPYNRVRPKVLLHYPLHLKNARSAKCGGTGGISGIYGVGLSFLHGHHHHVCPTLHRIIPTHPINGPGPLNPGAATDSKCNREHRTIVP